MDPAWRQRERMREPDIDALAAELEKLATAAYREAWHWEWEGEVDAAVAVIDGPAANQSWRNIAQALLQASRVVRVGGTIIIASQLNTQPGPALNSLIRDEHSPEEEQLALLRLRSADAVAAQIVRDCLETHRLFFQTHLEDAVIEELGCGAWHSASELERLLREHESCVVIGSAQQVSLQLRVEA